MHVGRKCRVHGVANTSSYLEDVAAALEVDSGCIKGVSMPVTHLPSYMKPGALRGRLPTRPHVCGGVQAAHFSQAFFCVQSV